MNECYIINNFNILQQILALTRISLMSRIILDVIVSFCLNSDVSFKVIIHYE